MDEIQSLLKRARRSGWKIHRTANRHYKLLSPNGKDIVIVSGTASDFRTVKNTEAQLRRLVHARHRHAS